MATIEKSNATVGDVIFLNDENWEDCINQDKVTLVYFMSGSHLDCRRQIPQVKDFAENHGKSYNVGVIDVTRNPIATQACEIEGIPTMVIFRRGMVLGGHRGRVGEDEVPDLLQRLDVLQKIDPDVLQRSMV